MLRRVGPSRWSPHPLEKDWPHYKVSCTKFLSHPWDRSRTGKPSSREGKSRFSSWLSQLFGFSGWYCLSPCVPDWVDTLIYLEVTFHFGLGSGKFYSLRLTQYAPKWRNLYILSIFVALGNVLNGIWWLKVRYDCPVTKKLMIKAPLIAFTLLLSHNTLPLLFIHANEVRIEWEQTVCQQVGLNTRNLFFFPFK